MDWTDLAPDRDNWWLTVHTIMKLEVLKKIRGISSLAEELSASKDELCSM